MKKKDKRSGLFKNGLDTAGKRLLVLTVAILMTFQFCTPTFSGVSFADEETVAQESAEAVETVTEEAQEAVQETETPVQGEQSVTQETGDVSEEAAAETVAPEQPAEAAQEEAAAPQETAQEQVSLNEKAISFNATANNNVKVRVNAEPGTFPVGTEMKVAPVADSDVEEAVSGALNAEVTNYKAVDITFVCDGNEVQPQKEVSVSLSTSEFDADADLSVVHITEDGAEKIEDAAVNADNTKATFQADHFSVYVVVQTGEDARLEVTFMNGETEIASTIVKKSDIDSGIFEQIVYDPGAGELGDGEVFRGWTTNADYTVDDVDSGMNIDGVRDAVKAKLNEGVTETDGKPATMKVYAMVFRAVNITYKDEDGVVIRNEAVLMSRDDTSEFEYEVNEAYVPKTSDQEFQGWYFTSSADVKDAEGNTIPEGSIIANETTVKISANLVLTVKAPKGAWLIFKENGKGASYTSPQFLEGEKPEIPTEPTRFGYTFGGWYIDEACTDGNEFDFDQVLTATTRVYAKWTENTTANYTVIIWKQKASDAKNAADNAKTYDFAESVSLSGNVGTTINTVTATGTGDDRYASVNGTAKKYTGFHLGRYDQNETIKVDGTSVVNVYYDRNLITLTFQYRNNGSWATQTTMTGLYGSTLQANGYTWPTNRWWYDDYEQNWGGGYSGAGTRTTFLDAFIISDGSSSQTFYGFNGNGNNTIRWYKQLANGNWPALNSPTNTATASNGTFSISDKYNGYHAVSYSTNGGNSWTALGDKNADGYYATGINTSNGLWIRFAPDLYNIQFTDGVYVDGNGVGVEGYSSRGELKVEKDVPYASDISAYNKGGSKYYEPTYDGFVFEGWYLDDTCTQACIFTTMPEGMQVYAKWIQKQYRVFLHPEVPTSDTTLSMGEQATSFRIDYNESIKAIDARRDDYELVGWYTDEACTKPFNFDAYVLNDTTVTTAYDQTQSTETDTYGNPTENTNKDKVEGRFWITKKLDLYAKWRSKLIGANGITVVYDAADGSFSGGATTYTDPLTYKDLAKAVATTASTPTDTDKKEFECWSIYKWNGSSFEDTGETVLPGDSFEVKKAYTQQTENEGSTEENPSYTYTFKLVAQYKDIEEETPTHIIWYANNKTDASKNDDGLKMNQAIDIEPATLFNYAGYDFVGWARYETGQSPSSPTDDTNLWLTYKDEKFYTTDNKEAKQVACDEKNPYHDLYAVWEAIDVNYTVEFYYQNDNGEGYTKDDTLTATRQAKTDSTVNATDADKAQTKDDKYKFHNGEPNVLTATVAGNGNTVLKVYFDLNKVPVTVEHYLKGQTEPFKTTTETDKVVGSQISVTPETTYQEKNLTVDSYVPVQPVTVKVSGNLVKVYYTLPLTITAKTDSKTYDSTPLDGAYTVEGQLTADTTAINTALGTAPSITNVSESPKQYLTAEDQAKITGIPEYYVVSYTPGTLTIDPKKVTITAKDASKTYDGEALTQPEFTATALEANDKHTFTVVMTAASTITNVGTQKNVIATVDGVAVTTETETAVGNYLVTTADGTLTITKAGTLTVTATGYTGTYDAQSHAASATPSITEGTTVEYSIDGGKNWTAVAPTIIDVGEQAVQVRATNPNYENATANCTLKVTPKPVTVTAAIASKVYGTTDPAFTASVSGVIDDYEITYNVTRPGAGTDENVGTYPKAIVPAGEATQGNYTVTYVPADFTITKAPAAQLGLTANGYEGVYDAKDHAATASATVTEGTTIEFSTDGENWSTTAPTIKNVGEQAVQVRATNPNYETATANCTLKVTPAPVTVTANAASKTYGANDPAFAANVSGVLDDYEIKYTVTRPGAGTDENVGTYTDAIVAAGEATQGNYTVTYKPADFEITKAGTLTVTATGYEGIYDAQSHAASATPSITEGTTVEFSTDGGKTWSTTAPTIKDVGEQAVQVRATNPNYENATANCTLKVTPKPVTVTAAIASKVYGTTDPAFTASVSGVIDDYEITYNVTRPGAGTDENVGTYPKAIVPAGEATQGNYTVTYVPADFTITKAPAAQLGLTATGYEGVYDAKDHAASATATVTQGTTIEFSTDGENWSTTAPTIKNVGEQAVQVRATNPNYETATANCTLKVTPAPVTVTAVAASKTYGDADPAFTATVSGVIDDYTITYTVTRPGAGTDENAGTYPKAIVAAGEATQGNYTVTYVPADFTINKAKLTIKANDQTYTYNRKPQGEDNKTYSDASKVTVTGLKGSDALTSITLNGQETDAGEYAGKIAASNAQIGEATDNYAITYEAGKLTITPITETVTVTITGKSYNGEYDGAEHTAEGYDVKIDNDLYTVDDFEFTGTAKVSGTNAGTYPMGLAETQFSNKNTTNFKDVKFVVTDGKVEITKIKLVLKSEGDEKVYDEKPLTRNEQTDVKIVEGALAPTDEIHYDITGSQTYVGESDNLFTATITTKQGAAESVLNTIKSFFTAYADDETGNFPQDNYDITYKYGTLKVTDDGVDPDDVVTKTHEETTYNVGDTITFTIEVKNIYDEAKTITLTEQEGVTFVEEDGWTITGNKAVTDDEVASGETVTIKATYTVTEEDAKAGTFKNTVTVDFGEGTTPTSNDDTVDTFAHMTVTKAVVNKPADGKVFRTGETIKYEVTVTNDGTAELTDIVVKDELTGDEWKVDSLAVGKSKTFKAEYKVTEKDAAAGSVTNVATAEAKDPEGDTTPGIEGKVVTDTDKAIEPAPKTGDTTPIVEYTVMLSASVALLLMTLSRRRKNRA